MISVTSTRLVLFSFFSRWLNERTAQLDSDFRWMKSLRWPAQVQVHDAKRAPDATKRDWNSKTGGWSVAYSWKRRAGQLPRLGLCFWALGNCWCWQSDFQLLGTLGPVFRWAFIPWPYTSQAQPGLPRHWWGFAPRHPNPPFLFSERELTFTLAICYRPSVCLSVVCLSSVCL